ncbi:D-alanyl-D-alanine carboxypeptidase family protein [Sabulicella glaciei]|uniref:Serine hydrolase n=1 Tax=Sabulicella glaciei TaxID=2984948 RepID=A0ABT3NPP6_9PROT|nr:serine hydrolase [Roseococcus sp. MDT2-1-1]MCW8084140.1 serine hydrolase [Roseococcus sp. MDT2-1-1]
MRLPVLARRLALCAAFAVTAAIPAQAQLLESPRYASIVTEARSGNVLSATNADDLRHPASLTKMMTLYMLFEAMQAGRVDLSTPIRFSGTAASRPPSKLGVPAGGTISAETAILALVTRSANDVASAVGEHLAGSEEAFGRMMTMRARSLGMTRTTFRNASGLPDPEQVTTARDMALLGRRLFTDFPDRYSYFAVTQFAHGRQMIRNHNGMLHDYPGADGIKTGFINASGFNIVTSAQRDGVRLVGAVFGGNSWYQRNRHMAELLDDGFDRMGVRRGAAMASAPISRPTPIRVVAPVATPNTPASRRAAAAASRAESSRAQGSRAATARPAARPTAQRPVRVIHRPANPARPAASRPASTRPAATPATRSRPATSRPGSRTTRG